MRVCAHIHTYVCISCFCLLFYYALCFSTLIALCFYDFFSLLPLLLRFESYQQQRKCNIHQYMRTHTYTCIHKHTYYCVCVQTFCLCILFFFTSFNCLLALAHIGPPAPLAHITPPHPPFSHASLCTWVDFNAQSMTVLCPMV